MFSVISSSFVRWGSIFFYHLVNIDANIVVCFGLNIAESVGTFSKIGGIIFLWLIVVHRFCQSAQLFTVVRQRWQSVHSNVSRGVRVPDTIACSSHWLQASPLFNEVTRGLVLGRISVLDNNWVVIVLVQHEACVGISLCVFVFDYALRARDHIVELVLHGNHLERVVPDQPWAQLFLVKIDKPVDERTVNPTVVNVWHRAEQVRGSTAMRVWDHGFFLIRVDHLLMMTKVSTYIRGRSKQILSLRGPFLRRHQ